MKCVYYNSLVRDLTEHWITVSSSKYVIDLCELTY